VSTPWASNFGGAVVNSAHCGPIVKSSLQIRPGAKSFDVVDGAHEGPPGRGHRARVPSRVSERAKVWSWGTRAPVISHHLLATLLSRPSGMKAIGW